MSDVIQFLKSYHWCGYFYNTTCICFVRNMKCPQDGLICDIVSLYHFSGFDISVQWFGKRATRIPESLSFYMSPWKPDTSLSWKSEVLANEDTMKEKKISAMSDKKLKFASDAVESKQIRIQKVMNLTFKVQKLGQLLPVDSVILNGSQYLHGE